MKRMLVAILLCGGVLLFSGCAAVPYQPGPLYTKAQAPRQATNNSANGPSGEACQQNILGIVAIGDASIDTAAEKGGIEKVATVDTKFTTILGLWSQSCTKVTGKGGG